MSIRTTRKIECDFPMKIENIRKENRYVAVDVHIYGHVYTFRSVSQTERDAENLAFVMNRIAHDEEDIKREEMSRRIDRQMHNAQERDRLERSNRSLRSLMKRLKAKKEEAK